MRAVILGAVLLATAVLGQWLRLAIRPAPG
jgi:hypothetical protein